MALTLKSIRFTNYKAFKKAQSIELKPITVLLGKNNSGKSVIARLPLLLHDALTGGPGDAPLSLQVGGVDFGSGFSDLVYNNNSDGELKLGVSFYDKKDDLTINIDSTLKGIPEDWRFQITDQRIELQELSFHIYFDKCQHILQDVIEPFNQVEFQGLLATNRIFSDLMVAASSLAQKKLASDDSLTSQDQYLLSHLMPSNASGESFDFDKLKALAQKIQSKEAQPSSEKLLRLFFLGNIINQQLAPVHYLGPFRKEPERFYRIPEFISSQLGMMGENAPIKLALEMRRSDNPLTQAINDWYTKNLGCNLVVQGCGKLFSVSVTKPDVNKDHCVNLVDVGAGISQILPIILQQKEAELTKEKIPGLYIVEQPELHLHPAAHGSLADLYIEGTKHGGQFLIETHSETLILRLRRRIAEGRLTPENVALYWVDDQLPEQAIRKIDIDSQGNVSDWPKDVFSEDYKEAMAIRRAQKQHH